MQSYHRVHVQLRKRDRMLVTEMLNKGRGSARVLRRASILRQLDRGQRAAQVADNVGVAPKTVRAIARRYVEEGLESALYEKPRPGQRRVLDAGQSQRIIAMVCGPPPQGQARWSVRLIAQEAVKRKLARRVGRETIRILLQHHELKPWREKNVNLPQPQTPSKGIVDFVLQYLEDSEAPDVSEFLYRSPIVGTQGQLWVMPAGMPDT